MCSKLVPQGFKGHSLMKVLHSWIASQGLYTLEDGSGLRSMLLVGCEGQAEMKRIRLLRIYVICPSVCYYHSIGGPCQHVAFVNKKLWF